MSDTKQRFLFLVVSYHTINFFRPIIKKLLARGHKVRVISIDPLPKGAFEDKFDAHQQDWHLFCWEKIENYDPTRVVVFNGSFGVINAATQALKKKYPLFCAEVAWFPQSENIYIDRSIHHLSNICLEAVFTGHGYKQNQEAIERLEPVIKRLQEKYKPRAKPPSTVDRNKSVLIPLQLEQDTSILYSSPHFKTMESLIGFALYSLPNTAQVVVKPHPKMDVPYFKKKIGRTLLNKIIFFEDRSYTLNDLVYHSRMVMGINSTGLMEALIHNRPVYQMGKNICSAAIDDLDKDQVRKFYRDYCYMGMQEEYFREQRNKARILTMMANQFKYSDPPEWVIHKLENFTTSARTLGDLLRDENL